MKSRRKSRTGESTSPGGTGANQLSAFLAEPSVGSRIFGLALIIATFIAYRPVLHGGFLWDDETHIQHNFNLHTAHGLWNIWFKPGDASSQYLQYYPLTFTVFWLEYHLWGLNTLGYHLVNVLFHGLVAILLWQVLRRLKVPGAWLAGAIFALHPVCVMSVAWMTELKNVLSATLALCAAWAYIRAAGIGVYGDREFQVSRFKSKGGAANEPATLDWRFYGLSLILFLLALFAKTAVSFLPVTLLLVAWWSGRKLNARSLWPVLPMFALAALFGLFTFYVEKHSGGASGQLFNLSYADRVLISGRSFWFYLGKIFFPWPLTFFYERWQVSPGVWWQDVFPLATIGLLVVLWLLRGRIGRGPFAALAHFYVSTSLLILLVVLYMTRYTFVSDHWQYFGCMGVIAIVAAGIVRALDGFTGATPALKAVACGILVAGLGMLTWRQCGMYADIKTLWTVTLERNPNCTAAHNDLGSLLLREAQDMEPARKAEQIAAAKKHFEAVLAINPDDPVANYNLGSALKDSQPAEALSYFERSLKANPDDAETRENIGNLLADHGRIDEALPHLRRAAELQPNNPNNHYNLATALLQKGRINEAIAEFKLELANNPNDGMGRANYGSALMQNGQLDDAIEQFKRAVSLMPKSALAHTFLGNAMLYKGVPDQAISEFRVALKIQPGFPLAKSRLLIVAWIWATHPEENARNGILAVRLTSDLLKEFGSQDPAVLATSAAAYAELGDFDQAVALASSAEPLANAQSNSVLVAQIRAELLAFRDKQPFRDLSLTNQLLH